MKRFLKLTGGVVAGVLLILIGVIINFLARGGAFNTLQPHFTGRCESLPTGGPSGEDIQIDRERGLAYISAFDRRALIRGEDVRGTVWQLDLNAATPELKPAITGAPEDFSISSTDNSNFLFLTLFMIIPVIGVFLSFAIFTA